MGNHPEIEPHVSPPPGDECLSTLFSIAQQCLRLGASGAAVAMIEGAELLVVARSGSAPGIGTRTPIENTLAGLPVRTGRLLRCDDTRCDPRVDARLCKQMNLGSALILPLKSDGQVLGILATFADVPNRFGPIYVAMIEPLALRAVAALLRESSQASTLASQQEVRPGEALSKLHRREGMEDDSIKVSEADIVSAILELRHQSKRGK